MSTDNNALASPAAPDSPHPLPAEPTPKASSFTRPHTPPLLALRPTLTTPTGPSKSESTRLTPTIEPASELMMVLVALDNMKTSLLADIHKVNKHVDDLILNPSNLVPSSQPYTDFSDFALPTTSKYNQFDTSMKPSDDLAKYTTLDEEIHTKGLYFDLAKILHSSSCCAAFSNDDHFDFAKFLHCILTELGWPLTPGSFLEEQLSHLARCWNACCTEKEASTKCFQDLDLFNDLFGMNFPRSADDLALFTMNIDCFCTHYRKSRPIPDSEFVFIKDFVTADAVSPRL
jgi:hypothetical protein